VGFCLQFVTINETAWENPLNFAYEENCAVVKIKMPNEPKTKIDVFKAILEGSNLNKDNVVGLENPENSLEYMKMIRFVCSSKAVEDKRIDLKNCFKDF
jgi:hypothetical protein